MKGMRETFTCYDTADYLKTEADIAAYLEACAEEAPMMRLHALGIGHGRACAQHEPVGRAGRHDAGWALQGNSGEGNPTLVNTLKVAKALGYRLALVPDRD